MNILKIKYAVALCKAKKEALKTTRMYLKQPSEVTRLKRNDAFAIWSILRAEAPFAISPSGIEILRYDGVFREYSHSALIAEEGIRAETPIVSADFSEQVERVLIEAGFEHDPVGVWYRKV